MLSDPETAMAARMAFSNEASVTSVDGRWPCESSSVIRSPVYFAARNCMLLAAGSVEVWGSDSPSASAIMPSVLPVDAVETAPGPGKRRSSYCRSSSPLMRPRLTLPTPSKTSS